MKSRLQRLAYRRFNVSFSKSGDDIQLMKLLNQRSPGTYVDVGCWHPTLASNTYYFSVRGWQGICIDPNPDLQAEYAKARPTDTFVRCGIGATEADLKYYVLSDANSSMNTLDLEFLRAQGLESAIEKVIDVPVRTLGDVLERNLDSNLRLDFFDIDVEGLDLEVLTSNDWVRFRPTVVVVETDLAIEDALTSDISRYLQDLDYRLAAKSVMAGDVGNLFFLDNWTKRRHVR